MSVVKQLKKETVTLDFKPYPAQEEIAEAMLTHSRVVVRAGRRFGKSALALNLVFREALHKPGRYWIIAPEYKQAKSIYWRELVDKYIPKALIVNKNNNELILEIKTLNGESSIIEFKGSDRDDSLRGAGLAGVVLDEYAFQREHVWDKIISPMLIQTNGWALFITTPNGVANHFKKFWDTAVAVESEGDPDWKTFHFTSYDNPSPGMADRLDKERARLTEEYFTQEYMAEFAKFAGLIFTDFDPAIHIREFEVDENWSFYRGMDFGATDPASVPFIGVDKEGIIYIYDEIYVSDLQTSQFAELIKQKSAHRYFVGTYADSAGKQNILDLAGMGVYSTPVKKNTGESHNEWLIATIREVHQLFHDNKVVIHPRCKGMIKELMSYSWRKDRMGEAINLPEDRNNHLIDAFRYFVTTYKGPLKEEAMNYLQKGQVDPVTGY